MSDFDLDRGAKGSRMNGAGGAAKGSSRKHDGFADSNRRRSPYRLSVGGDKKLLSSDDIK